MKLIPNSFIYQYKGMISYSQTKKICHKPRCVVLCISNEIYYLFVADTNDFSDEEIQHIKVTQQIYINKNMGSTSSHFQRDYKKLVQNPEGYFTISPKDVFLESEEDVYPIIRNLMRGNVLDVGCGECFYRNIIIDSKVSYLGIDTAIPSDFPFPFQNTNFEAFQSNTKFQSIFFLRSINHIYDTAGVLQKSYDLLEEGGYIFIIENQLFGELKFPQQHFESQKEYYEHYHNYTLSEFEKLLGDFHFQIILSQEVTSTQANQWYICLRKFKKDIF